MSTSMPPPVFTNVPKEKAKLDSDSESIDMEIDSSPVAPNKLDLESTHTPIAGVPPPQTLETEDIRIAREKSIKIELIRDRILKACNLQRSELVDEIAENMSDSDMIFTDGRMLDNESFNNLMLVTAQSLGKSLGILADREGDVEPREVEEDAYGDTDEDEERRMDEELDHYDDIEFDLDNKGKGKQTDSQKQIEDEIPANVDTAGKGEARGASKATADEKTAGVSFIAHLPPLCSHIAFKAINPSSAGVRKVKPLSHIGMLRFMYQQIYLIFQLVNIHEVYCVAEGEFKVMQDPWYPATYSCACVNSILSKSDFNIHFTCSQHIRYSDYLQWFQEPYNVWEYEEAIEDANILYSFWKAITGGKSKMSPRKTRKPSKAWLGMRLGQLYFLVP
jgi:hypothetical protein